MNTPRIQHSARTEQSKSKPAFWSLDLWVLSDQLPGETMRKVSVQWNYPVTADKRFTDAEFDELRESCKCFLWSLMSDPPTGYRVAAPRSVAAISELLRTLVLWMIAERIRCFRDLDSASCLAFHEYVAQRKNRSGSPLSASTINRYLSLLDVNFRQRIKISDAIQCDPFPGRKTAEVAGFKYSNHGSLLYTPESIMKPLLLESTAWIGTWRSEIMPAFAEAMTIYSKSIHSGGSVSLAEYEANRLLTRIRPSPKLQERLGSPRLSVATLRKLLRLLIVACFITITYLVGCRPREALSLKKGCIRKPNSDELEGMNELHGMLIKTRATRREHRWIAPDYVADAVRVLEQLGDMLKTDSPPDLLFKLANVSVKDFGIPGRAELCVISILGMSQSMNDFGKWISLPTHNGKTWKLSTYQGRKTFARVVALRDRTSLFALAEHYGHVDISITDSSYAGRDHDLEKEIEREVLAQSVTAWEVMLTSPSLAGRAGQEIISTRPRFRGTTAKIEIEQYSNLLAKKGLKLAPCSWGYCVYRQSQSACHGTVAGPDTKYREPSTCARCKNFVVSEAHRGFWTHELDVNRAVARNSVASHQARAIARTRIAEAKQILSQLKTPIAPDE